MFERKSFWLHKKLWLPRRRSEVFEFFADPRNLDRLTPPWLKFALVAPPQSAIHAGTRLDYRLRLHGVPIRWQSEISVWEPPCRFVDRQTRGPYRLWVHEHSFLEENSGTLVRDDVEYAVLGGWAVQRLLVAPDLDRVFAYRHRALTALFNPAAAQERAL